MGFIWGRKKKFLSAAQSFGCGMACLAGLASVSCSPALLNAARQALLASSSSSSSNSSSGVADIAFDGDGYRLTQTGASTLAGGSNEEVFDVKVDSSGRTVVVGYSENAGGDNIAFVARYLNNGTLDTSFGGGDGIYFGRTDATTSLFLGGGADKWESVAIDSSTGDIFVSGDSAVSVAPDQRKAVLMKLSSSGALDTTFNNPDGYVITEIPGGLGFAQEAVAGANDYYSEGKKVLTSTGNTVLMAGTAYAQSAGACGTMWSWYVARYTSAGALDTSFGEGAGPRTGYRLSSYCNGGVFTAAPWGGTAVVLKSLAQNQATGQIIVVGNVNVTSNQAVVAAYETDGDFDTTFNTTGYNVAGDNDFGDGAGTDEESLYGLAIDGSGRIITVGFAKRGGGTETSSLIARYTAAGILDTTFNTPGTDGFHEGLDYNAAGFSGSYTRENFYKVLIDSATGKYIAVGAAGCDYGLTAAPTQSCGRGLIVRFNTDGTVDTAFNAAATFPGAAGSILGPDPTYGGGTSGGGTWRELFRVIAEHPLGKFVVAGPSRTAASENRGLVLRFDSSWNLDN
ncbi:MAG: hypothetical protein AB1540_15755 [Bdellovibrionota bacterium]